MLFIKKLYDNYFYCNIYLIIKIIQRFIEFKNPNSSWILLFTKSSFPVRILVLL
jgi:hypothetical protein